MHDLLYLVLKANTTQWTAVTKFITDTCKAFNENEASLAVYLDLSSIWYDYSQYFTEKVDLYVKQFVHYMGSNSQVEASKCAVLQGSVLVP